MPPPALGRSTMDPALQKDSGPKATATPTTQTPCARGRCTTVHSCNNLTPFPKVQLCFRTPRLRPLVVRPLVGSAVCFLHWSRLSIMKARGEVVKLFALCVLMRRRHGAPDSGSPQADSASCSTPHTPPSVASVLLKQDCISQAAQLVAAQTSGTQGWRQTRRQQARKIKANQVKKNRRCKGKGRRQKGTGRAKFVMTAWHPQEASRRYSQGCNQRVHWVAAGSLAHHTGVRST